MVKEDDWLLTLAQDSLESLTELFLDGLQLLIVLALLVHEASHVGVGALDHAVEAVGRATAAVSALQPRDQHLRTLHERVIS